MPFNGEGIVSSTNGADWNIKIFTGKRMRLDFYFKPYTKINSK